VLPQSLKLVEALQLHLEVQCCAAVGAGQRDQGVVKHIIEDPQHFLASQETRSTLRLHPARAGAYPNAIQNDESDMAKKAISTKEPVRGKGIPPLPAPAKASIGTKSRSVPKAAAAQPVATSAAKAKAKSQTKAPAQAAAPTTVTLKHLSAGIVERHGLPKKQADTVLAEVFAQLVDHLKAGDRVRIGGFGIIQVKDRPARMGRNPATGEAIQSEASRKIAFRAAKELRDAI